MPMLNCNITSPTHGSRNRLNRVIIPCFFRLYIFTTSHRWTKINGDDINVIVNSLLKMDKL